MSDWLFLVARFFEKNDVCELLLNGPEQTYIKDGSLHTRVSNIFSNKTSMTEALQIFAITSGLRLDPKVPYQGGTIQMPDLILRWHFIISPASKDGPIACFRRHIFSLSESLSFQNKYKWQLIQYLFQKRENLLFCGATGSGKTTMLSSLLARYSQNERVFIIEDLEELPIHSGLWLKVVAKKPDLDGKHALSMQDLFREGLRITPDRIVIGEMRSLESEVFFESILTGHLGCLSTIHALSATSLAKRLDFICQKAKIKLLPNRKNACARFWTITLSKNSPPLIEKIRPVYIG